MKKVCLLLAGMLCLCSGCSSGSSTESSQAAGISSAVSADSRVVSEESEVSAVKTPYSVFSYVVKEAETPAAADASVEKPLALGEWGMAAKYCTEHNYYLDVPVRITAIRRGAAVNDEVRELMAQSEQYFFEPSENEEYAIAEYEICLNDFSVGKGGTLCDITAFITGEDGEALALEDGSYWGTTVSCLDQETYFYEGVIHSMMAFRIVKGRSDYLIIAGEYGKTQTFFKGQ